MAAVLHLAIPPKSVTDIGTFGANGFQGPGGIVAELAEMLLPKTERTGMLRPRPGPTPMYMYFAIKSPSQNWYSITSPATPTRSASLEPFAIAAPRPKAEV